MTANERGTRVPRWVVCIAVGLCIACLYFAANALLSYRGSYRKHGDGASISQWFDALEWVTGDFPFGYWIDDYSLGVLLNGLFCKPRRGQPRTFEYAGPTPGPTTLFLDSSPLSTSSHETGRSAGSSRNSTFPSGSHNA
jgi:hypothetical protein